MVEPIAATIPFITLNGYPASGKSSSGLILAERLGWEYETTGGIMRTMALQDGMNPDSYFARGTTNDGRSIDAVLDERQIMLGKTTIEFVLDGRLAFHFIPESYKIHFTVDPDIAGYRAFHDKDNKLRVKYASVDEATKRIERIVKTEQERYQKLYGINQMDHGHYNLVLDTTHMAPDEVNEEIFYHAKSFLDSIGYFEGTYQKP